MPSPEGLTHKLMHTTTGDVSDLTHAKLEAHQMALLWHNVISKKISSIKASTSVSFIMQAQTERRAGRGKVL